MLILDATSLLRRHAGHEERVNNENLPPNSDFDCWEEKPPSLMRAPKPAAIMLQSMMKEVNSARGWLREISAGQAGSNGPYFSPCHVKGGNGGGSPSFHTHPLYIELSASSMDYNAILNSKLDPKEPAKRAIQQATVIQKLRQVCDHKFEQDFYKVIDGTMFYI